MDSYAIQAVQALEKENKVIQAMKQNKSIEEIVRMINQNRKWNWGFFVWGLLALSIPILF